MPHTSFPTIRSSPRAQRWRRFAVLGQIKYGEAALRAISRDPKCPTLHREAQNILIDIENLMTKYKETLK